uniref:Uncharacterized protein n=1 Tax=Meloidogyne enterolobii TaxID=390850 RepID=A0A6V7Y8R9_MELEN|nr:unnamed protein product [Meloidogyne enterolobii]
MGATRNLLMKTATLITLDSNFCNNSKKCEKCGVVWNVAVNNRNGRNGHVCSERYCNTCFSFHDPKRGCFIKPLTPRKPKPYRIIAFDFETMQHKQGEKGKLHEVNFISAKINCPECIVKRNNNCTVCGEDRTITFSHQPFSNTQVDQQNVTNDPLTDFVSWITSFSLIQSPSLILEEGLIWSLSSKHCISRD